MSLRKFRDELAAFHHNERGESSTMANVMMLAIAAVVVVALVAFGNAGLKWLQDTWKTIRKDGKEAEDTEFGP